MSSQQDTPKPWDDERITAYVMNELDVEQSDAFETEIQNDAELAVAVEQAREVTAKLAGFYGSLPEESLDRERRNEVLSSTEGGSAEPASPKVTRHEIRRFPWMTVVIAASIVFVLAGITIPMVTDFASRNVAMNAPDTAERDIRSSLLEDETIASDGIVVLDQMAVTEPQMTSEEVALEIASAKAAGQAYPTTLKYDEKESAQKRIASPSTIAEPSGNTVSRPYAVAPAMEAPEAPPAPPASVLFKDSSTSKGQDASLEKMNRGTDLELAGPGSGATVSNSQLLRSRRRIPRSALLESSAGKSSPPVIVVKPVEDMDMMLQGGVMDMEIHMGGRITEKDMMFLDKEMMPATEIDAGFGMAMDTPSGDRYAAIIENTFKRVDEEPLSTLSIDVDTASYSKVRMSLQRNRLPSPDAVRIEEMINYFDYDYPDVNDKINSETGKPDPFSASMNVTECPWEPKHRLVRVGLQAVELDKKERPRCNLVFLIDTSGSMSSQNKLPLLIEGFKLMLGELRDDDQVAIVVYAGSAGLVLDSTPAKKRNKITKALSALKSGGSTNGGAGLRLAYETARQNFIKEGVNRVILCSDGDFNVGMTGTDELVREAKSQAKSGVDLTVLGFGMGNHNDAMMERISNDAEGNYAFVDTIAESKKVLGDQLAGTLVTVAKDVKIQIEFNPSIVSAYRLIGYENRLLAKEDFNDDTKDAGEIGAGHRVTALYQVVPAGVELESVAPAVDPLRYQKPKKVAKPEVELTEEASNEMLLLQLRYKPPQGSKSTLMTRTLVDEGVKFEDVDEDFRFAAAVAGFGMQLRNSPLAGSWTYDDVLQVAIQAKGDDEHGLRAEMIEMAATANNLSGR